MWPVAITKISTATAKANEAKVFQSTNRREISLLFGLLLRRLD
jgi:hypothetical protein